ncbi:MAG: hypothetical protein K6G28_00280, partial [Acholeplasmatales bacterium]|nr:hypothetical protein [Acholeplasmatales bacterium]
LNTKDFITKEIKINKSNYIKFSAPDSNVIIKEIVITYNSKASPKEEKLTYDGYRLKLNYTEFDNLVDGETREIPTKVNFNGSNYTVLETKKFTYYSREYLINHYANSMADELAITDPLEVASYYMLFHDFPLNYGYQFDLIDMDLYFKEKNLRRVQKFSRTDGYAKAIPYKKNQDLTYLELDFAESDSYSYNAQRGTGRIVVWENGFDGSGYDNEPVCLYTDDHYASFAEFTNCYSWNTSFDAEMNYTGYKHSVVKTYTL